MGIIGGGIAGASLAIALRKRGISVAVVERSVFPAREVGEVLVPESCVQLDFLGVYDGFVQLENWKSEGILSAWGSESLRCYDSFTNAYGPAWIVRRQKLVQLLQRETKKLEAQFFNHSIVRDLRREGNAWSMVISRRGSLFRLNCDFVVCATGRIGGNFPVFARKKEKYDALVALGFCLERPPAWDARDRRPLIESVQDGWWYSVLISARVVFTAFFTDADILKKKSASFRDRPTFLRAELANSVHHAKRLQSKLTIITKPLVHAAHTAINISSNQGSQLNVGDAAFSMDPLSGQGIRFAMMSGIQAAATIHAVNSGDSGAINRHILLDHEAFLSNLEQRCTYYNLERRWPNSVFWKRRHLNAQPLSSTRQSSEDFRE